MESDRERRNLTASERAQCLIAACVFVVPLLLASLLTPDARGHGTHEQLGLPPCMTQRVLGIPCLFCGMTTSFAWFAHGHPVHAFFVQPAAALLATLLIFGSIAAGLAGACGRLPCRLQKRWRSFSAGAAGFILVVSWVYKLIATMIYF